jgi:hypothetical protein
MSESGTKCLNDSELEASQKKSNYHMVEVVAELFLKEENGMA